MRAWQVPERRAVRRGELPVGQYADGNRHPVLVRIAQHAFAFFVDREPFVRKKFLHRLGGGIERAREDTLCVQGVDRTEESGVRIRIIAILLRVVAQFSRHDEGPRTGIACRKPNGNILLSAESAEVRRIESLLGILSAGRKALHVKFNHALARLLKRRHHLTRATDELMQLKGERRTTARPVRLGVQTRKETPERRISLLT